MFRPVVTKWYSLLVVAGMFFNAAAEQASAPAVSAVDQRIAAAQTRIKGSSNAVQAYNDLAFAFCRKARDSEDSAFYDQAENALKSSFRLSPANYDARKLEVAVLLGKHEFQQALKLATELNHNVPDDINVWGLLVDANMALGNYSEAERGAQWILDLRPGSTLGFEKAAALRQWFGDAQGALEFLDEANRRTSQNDADQHAWLLTQKAQVELTQGDSKDAEILINQALKLNPESQLTRTVLAKLRMAQEKYQEAASLMETKFQKVQSSANLYLWAEALEKSGQKEKAAATFHMFEVKAQAEMPNAWNSNRDLVFFYLSYKSDPPEALAIAAKLSKEQPASPNLEAFAWALYGNGRYSEAQSEMNRALAVGVRDPVYFCHAAQIADKAKDLTSAVKYRKELTALGDSACPAEPAIQAAAGARP